MKFEHLIEINELDNPLIPVFSRKQLWNGLVLRAEFPKLFLFNLDTCTITSRSSEGLTRNLQFGELTINDQVQFSAMNFVHYQVPRQREIPTSSMRMTIEEQAFPHLFVRFSYDSEATESEDKENALYDRYRRSAYIEADLDTIKVLREMRSLGRLNSD
ncbi:MAG: hypothetical protein K0R08_2045 [Solimicrobium sp.]|nr:hypothetical protein [Solimicrobium sp.]